MKTVIIYASVHHNNTKKIVDVIADMGLILLMQLRLLKRIYQGMIS